MKQQIYAGIIIACTAISVTLCVLLLLNAVELHSLVEERDARFELEQTNMKFWACNKAKWQCESYGAGFYWKNDSPWDWECLYNDTTVDECVWGG